MHCVSTFTVSDQIDSCGEVYVFEFGKVREFFVYSTQTGRTMRSEFDRKLLLDRLHKSLPAMSLLFFVRLVGFYLSVVIVATIRDIAGK